MRKPSAPSRLRTTLPPSIAASTANAPSARPSSTFQVRSALAAARTRWPSTREPPAAPSTTTGAVPGAAGAWKPARTLPETSVVGGLT